MATTAKSKEIQKPRQMRANNCKAIMSMFRVTDTLQISDIAREINLSKTTVSKIVMSLVNQGFLLSNGKGASTEEGGKKPELFSLNPQHSHCLTVGIENGKVRGCLFDMGIRLKASAEHIIENDAAFTYQEAVEVCVGLCEQLLCAAGLTKEDVFGISCYAGGIIDGKNGILCYPIRHPHWGRDLPFQKDFQKKYGRKVPVYVENSVRFSSYAEMSNMKEKQNTSCAVIFSSPEGPGVGGCMIRRGEIVHGSSNFVGEFGHMLVAPNSHRKCICGNCGCLEAEVSPQALVQDAYDGRAQHPDSLLEPHMHGGTLCAADVYAAADRGDAFARELLDKIIHSYMVCIWNIIITSDPKTIILQGIPAGDDSYFIHTLRQKMQQIPFFGLAHQANIELSHLGSTIVELMHRGAALYACNKYFNDSSLYEKG